MREVCLEAVWNIQVEAPEVVQARDWGAQDEPWIRQEHQRGQGRAGAEDVKGTMGMR